MKLGAAPDQQELVAAGLDGVRRPADMSADTDEISTLIRMSRLPPARCPDCDEPDPVLSRGIIPGNSDFRGLCLIWPGGRPRSAASGASRRCPAESRVCRRD